MALITPLPFPPHVLPDDWRGAFLLLAIVFVLSSFLDNQGHIEQRVQVTDHASSSQVSSAEERGAE